MAAPNPDRETPSEREPAPAGVADRRRKPASGSRPPPVLWVIALSIHGIVLIGSAFVVSDPERLLPKRETPKTAEAAVEPEVVRISSDAMQAAQTAQSRKPPPDIDPRTLRFIAEIEIAHGAFSDVRIAPPETPAPVRRGADLPMPEAPLYAEGRHVSAPASRTRGEDPSLVEGRRNRRLLWNVEPDASLPPLVLRIEPPPPPLVNEELPLDPASAEPSPGAPPAYEGTLSLAEAEPPAARLAARSKGGPALGVGPFHSSDARGLRRR